MNLEQQISIRTVLITGASSGIGAGVAKAFAMNGARVAINFPTEREKTAAQVVLGEITSNGGEGLLVMADVRQEVQVERMVAEVLDSFGHLDVLINNAGVAAASLIEDTSLDDWQRTIDTHLKGTFLCGMP